MPLRRGSRGLLLLLILLITAIAGVSVQGPRLAEASRRKALAGLTTGQLRQRLEKAPGDDLARRTYARSLAEQNNLSEATREYVALIQRHPTDAELLNDLGVLYILQQRYYEALITLRGSLESRPGYAAALANLGRLHLATEMPFTARDELERAVKADPGSVTAWCDLGEACQRTLNFTAAEQAYRRALRVRPGHVPALVGLGRVLFSLTRYDEAGAMLRQALDRDPRNATALLTLGRMRLETQRGAADLAAARDLVEQSLVADPQEPEAWYDLGRIDLRQNRPEEAVRNFRRTLQLSSDHPGATNLLGRALREAGRPGEAERVERIFRNMSLLTREESRLEERTRQHPGDVELKTQLAELYVQTGKPSLAALILRQLPDGAMRADRRRRLEMSIAAAAAASPISSPSSGSGTGP